MLNTLPPPPCRSIDKQERQIRMKNITKITCSSIWNLYDGQLNHFYLRLHKVLFFCWPNEMKKSSTEAFHVYLLFWFLPSYAWPSINDFAVHSEIEKQLSESGLIEKRRHMLFNLLHRIPLLSPWWNPIPRPCILD